MSLRATYDSDADVVWFRFASFDGAKVSSVHADWGLRDVDRDTGETVALEFWRASEQLPAELLEQLPSPAPPVGAAATS